MSILGDAVREARTARRWSKAALAAEAGMNERTVARLEAGHRVSAGSVAAVLRVLGIDMPAETGGEPRPVTVEDAPHPGRVGIVCPDWMVGFPPAAGRDHRRKRDMLLRAALAREPGAIPVVSDVPAFDAASQVACPTRHASLSPTERMRRAERDKALVDHVGFLVNFAVASTMIYYCNAMYMSMTQYAVVTLLLCCVDVITLVGMLALGLSVPGGVPECLTWPFLRRFGRAAEWTGRSVRLRETVHVVRGPVLTECTVVQGRIEMYEYRLDFWSVDVRPEGMTHATVTLRADGRFDETLDFVPVGPGLDALLAGAGVDPLPLAA